MSSTELNPVKNRPVVYCLFDPATKDLRYVGVSNSVVKRIQSHTKASQIRREIEKGNRHKGSWLLSLAERGLSPQPAVLQICSSFEDALAQERHWISLFRQLGFALLNKTEGGEGVSGHRHSEEQRRRIATETKKAMARPEVRKNLSTALRGRVAWNKGKKGSISEATRQKMSAAAKKRTPNFLGKTHSEASRKKMSDSKKGIVYPGNGKPVKDQFNNFYRSASEASRFIGCGSSQVRNQLAGRQKTVHGYVFSYVLHESQL